MMNSRHLDIESVFQHELTPVPTALFNENGNRHSTKTKSTLKNKLKVEKSNRNLQKPDVYLADGCAIFWVVHWPSQGTLHDYVDSVVEYVVDILKYRDVYLVFTDRGNEYSTKIITITSRAGKHASRNHQLNLDTPLPPQQVF